jgi:hypothetical protein
MEFSEGLLKETLDEYLLFITEIEEKLVRVEERIAREAEQPEYIWKYKHLLFAAKQKQVAVAAVARELAGFTWALANDQMN